MKVLCSACEAAEARVLCCADDAALCARCDRDVHRANPLAGKHHRLPLLAPSAAVSSPPNCDICQECHAYFFCVEDRALLCRSCDVAVHTANAFVSAHRRFLLTGVQVGLETHSPDDQPQPEPALQPPNAASAAPLLQTPCTRKGSPSPYNGDDDDDITGNLPDWSVVGEQFSSPAFRPEAEPVVAKAQPKRSPRGHFTAGNAPVFGGLGGSPDWPLDELFGFTDFNAGFGFTENGTSKADNPKLGSTDGSADTAAATAARDMFGQVPEVHWAVPEHPSRALPTASGLHWQGHPRYHTGTDMAMSVPDIATPENPFRNFASEPLSPPVKRQRRC